MRIWFGTRRFGDFGEGIAICKGEEQIEEDGVLSSIDASSSRPVSMDDRGGSAVSEDEVELVGSWFARWDNR